MNTIGWAVKEAHNGKRVARSGWNGKGMFVFYINNWSYDVNGRPSPPTLPFLAMKTAQGAVVPWLCSQTDILATDWEIVA